MKPLVTIAVLFLCLGFQSGIINQEEKPVYVCVSPYAKKYHLKKDCKGLSECTHTIEPKTLKEAQEMKLTLCGLEK